MLWNGDIPRSVQEYMEGRPVGSSDYKLSAFRVKRFLPRLLALIRVHGLGARRIAIHYVGLGPSAAGALAIASHVQRGAGARLGSREATGYPGRPKRAWWAC